jgi:hypothetical protein
MLENWLIVITGVAVFAVAGFAAYRKWGVRPPLRDDDDEASDVAPLLYLTRPRHTQPALATAVAGGEAPVRAAARPHARSYVAPTSGAGVDGTLQLWPGRLEAADGAGQEIRFIRTPGVNRFTFGRSAGPAQTHIQLLVATASRMHAFMVIENGRWRIGNMSETNQVLVNGVALETGDADRWLEDGDRIELGEVTFVFKER